MNEIVCIAVIFFFLFDVEWDDTQTHYFNALTTKDNVKLIATKNTKIEAIALK